MAASWLKKTTGLLARPPHLPKERRHSPSHSTSGLDVSDEIAERQLFEAEAEQLAISSLENASKELINTVEGSAIIKLKLNKLRAERGGSSRAGSLKHTPPSPHPISPSSTNVANLSLKLSARESPKQKTPGRSPRREALGGEILSTTKTTPRARLHDKIKNLEVENNILWETNEDLTRRNEILQEQLSCVQDGEEPDDWIFSKLSTDENLRLDETNNVITASIYKLVERITSPTITIPMNQKQLELIDVVLCTFPCFCSQETLLDLLISRYNGPKTGLSVKHFERIKSEVQRKVCIVIERLLWSGIKLDSHVSNKLQKFVKKLTNKRHSQILVRGMKHRNKAEKPSPATEDATIEEEASILKESVEVVAQQLCLIDSALAHKVTSEEFTNQSWNKDGKEENAPNILRMIARFNKQSFWYQSMIVQGTTEVERGKTLSFFIQLAKSLYDKQNFYGTMCVLGALESAAIHRLHHSWSEVSSKLRETLLELTSKSLSPNNNFDAYRTADAASVPPLVPYLGVYLTDCTFIDESNPGKGKSNGIVYVENMKLLSNRISSFLRAKEAEYKFPKDERIWTILQGLKTWTEQDIWRVSNLREPRGDGTGSKIVKSEKRWSSTMITGHEHMSIKGTLSNKDWAVLLATATQKTYPEGSKLLSHGRRNTTIYKIISGSVTLSVRSNEKDQKRLELAVLEEGSMFGDMSSLLEKYQRVSGTVHARTELVVWQIDATYLQALLQANSSLGEKFFRCLAEVLADRFAQRESKIKSLRLEPHLTSFEDCLTEKTEFQIQFDLPLSEVELCRTFCHWNLGKKDIPGKMKITPLHLCLQPSSHAKKQFCIPLTDIDLSLSETDQWLSVSHQGIDITLKFSEGAPFPRALVSWLKGSRQEFSSRKSCHRQYPSPLSPEDWEIILAGQKTVTYNKNEPIIEQNSVSQRIFQLAQGKARIEIEKEEVKDKSGADKLKALSVSTNKNLLTCVIRPTTETEKVVIGSVEKNGTFGEISFIKRGPATASVVADADQTQVYVIEGYFMRVIADMYPGLSSRFFQHICSLLASRLTSKERDKREGQKQGQ